VCDRYLAEVLDWLAPTHLVAIGVYAEEALRRARPGAEVVRILHPSPASPAANRDWAGSVSRALEEAGIWR
jgi:single-strand selective monofunctional uracil DNA glycosylase